MPLPGGLSCAVPYLSRAAWGADESLRFDSGGEIWPAEYYPVQAVTIHHTAGANNDPNPAATVRAIYAYQARDPETYWGDIGYHLLIDEAGRVYEGRWSGSDGVPVYGPTGANGRPLMSVGAHVGGYNTGNIGVCLLGDFTNTQPTAAARASVVTVLTSLLRLGALDPHATVDYVNPVNQNRKTINAISGHRDWQATLCPGNQFYPTLASVRDAVAARMSRPVPRPRAPMKFPE